MAPTKATPKKSISKKVAVKKAAPEKIKKEITEPMPKKAISPDTIEEGVPGDCKCKQKKPNGKFFSFRLKQGRWVQSSFVPFPTQELCEEANC